ncbi:hypothetical protein NL676_008251 [Syzygium grande]|nr:hypothetical protein NL676_008251 [Syzygium grande]
MDIGLSSPLALHLGVASSSVTASGHHLRGSAKVLPRAIPALPAVGKGLCGEAARPPIGKGLPRWPWAAQRPSSNLDEGIRASPYGR